MRVYRVLCPDHMKTGLGKGDPLFFERRDIAPTLGVPSFAFTTSCVNNPKPMKICPPIFTEPSTPLQCQDTGSGHETRSTLYFFLDLCTGHKL